MAVLIYRQYLQKQMLQRTRIFRDCHCPFEKFDDVELLKKNQILMIAHFSYHQLHLGQPY